MITVQLCGEFDFSHKDLSIRNYEKSITTDCWMKFHINEDLFFDDWICPLEMYYQYLDWKKTTIMVWLKVLNIPLMTMGKIQYFLLDKSTTCGLLIVF